MVLGSLSACSSLSTAVAFRNGYCSRKPWTDISPTPLVSCYGKPSLPSPSPLPPVEGRQELWKGKQDREGRRISGKRRPPFVKQEGRRVAEKRVIAEERDFLPVLEQSVELPGHVDFVSSVNNPFVKHIVKLRQNASYRYSHGAIVVTGSILLREMCEAIRRGGGKEPFLDYLFVVENGDAPEFVQWAKRRVDVTPSVMQKLSGLESSAKVEAIGVISFPASFFQQGLKSASPQVLSCWCPPHPRRLLVLDGIQDPGNLGTLLRTAAAFAWDGVLLIHGCCDPFNEKALRASRGACFRIPIAVVASWDEVQKLADKNAMSLFAGKPQYAMVDMETSADSTTPSMFTDMANEEALCLVLGNEGQGLSQQVSQACHPISIPMPGCFESLNVAVAGGILLFLLRRH